MFRNRFVQSFALTIAFYVLMNGLGLIYSLLCMKLRCTPNYYVSNVIVSVIVLGLALFYIQKSKITVINNRLSSKDVIPLITLVVVLVVFKLLVFNFPKEGVGAVTKDSSVSIGNTLLKAIDILFLAPVTEEFTFRVAILYILLNNRNLLLGICYSAFLFLLVHISPYSYSNGVYLSYVLIAGGFYAIIYLRYGILASIIVHVCLNIVMFAPLWNKSNPINLYIGSLPKSVAVVLITTVLALMVYFFLRNLREYKASLALKENG